MSQPTRAEIMRSFVPASPFAKELGIELVELRLDHAELRLPWSPRLATMGDVVHGGAIATLLDTAGMAAAWSDDTVPEKLAGATVSMSVTFAAAAVRDRPHRARATVVRRGRSLCFCEVTVTDADGRGRRPRLDGPPLRLSHRAPTARGAKTEAARGTGPTARMAVSRTRRSGRFPGPAALQQAPLSLGLTTGVSVGRRVAKETRSCRESSNRGAVTFADAVLDEPDPASEDRSPAQP